MNNEANLKQNSAYKSLVYLVLPAVFLFFALPFNRTHYGNDPEYAYLLNGINIGMLKPVGHTDNPGTTVQIYSAAVLRCTYLVQPDKSEGFQKHILRNADNYIEVERKGLIVLNGLVMLLIGIISWLMLRNIWFSLLMQIMPFVSPNLTEHVFTKVSPEPALLMATAAMALLIIRFYVGDKLEEKRLAVLFAIVSGFGLATKATFLPLTIIPLLLLEHRIYKKRYILLAILSFIAFTLPALPQYPHMAKWFLGLTVHTGTYGEGGLGLISPIQYMKDLVSILYFNPVLSLTILITALILGSSLLKSSFRSEFKNNTKFRILVALSAASFTGVLLVAKHYHANHYLIPELCLMATTWIFIFLYLNEKVPVNFRKTMAAVPVALLLITTGLVAGNSAYMKAVNQSYLRSNEDYEKKMNLIEHEYKGYTCAYYYPTSVNPYSALRWGNVYSKFRHTEAIKQIYPGGYFFDMRDLHFSLWDTPVATSTMAALSGNKLLIVGGPFEASDLAKIEHSGLEITSVYRGYTQILYKVEVNRN
jgi:hypothetical protein